ncbi:unnamed protein product [Brassicogethes aeneus]|uniref:Myrosinase 1-like n=1 Tax=Brassicogethes aeneus TaxID=1431903 RepID=A0A9P0BJB0_BRAAE|nr:unnamed protein product [Brassicogethes aeneus]
MRLLLFHHIVLSGYIFSEATKKFPDNFKFGVATSSYQIEGAWDKDGKSPSIWDHLTHTRPWHIEDGRNGDIACDSYYKYKEDVRMLKELGVDFYRFSIAWTRILPSGFINTINWDGVKYYNNLIDELLKNNIEPMVTLYHWDLPQTLQELGGWTNPIMEEYFAEYARLCFKLFGDKVKLWTTINEPRLVCLMGYGINVMAPAYNNTGIGDYLCGHTLLKAHARAYHIYDDEFRKDQKGKIFIVLEFQWLIPKTNSTADINVTETARHFMFGWFANPIYLGNYPKVMIDLVAERSAKQGFPKSRLPKFTEKEIDYIKGTTDFLGLNTYTSFLTNSEEFYDYKMVGFENDIGFQISHDPAWEATAQPQFKIVPWGTRQMLKWIKETYDSPEIFFTENGMADNGTSLDDQLRIKFYREQLKAVLDSMHKDDVKVSGYTAWSLMDNFEWVSGYNLKFGLYHVDFTSPNRTRTPKSSVAYMRKLFKTHCPIEECE